MDSTTPLPTVAPRIHAQTIRSRRNRRLLLVAVTILIAALSYTGYWWSYARFWVSTNTVYATGNFIHLVERAPVRIASAQDEIREHSLRPGLSTVTQIKASESGQSAGSSLATPSTAEYETDVYADELPTAESLTQGIVTTNLVPDHGRPMAKSGEHDVRGSSSLHKGGGLEADGKPPRAKVGGERTVQPLLGHDKRSKINHDKP